MSRGLVFRPACNARETGAQGQGDRRARSWNLSRIEEAVVEHLKGKRVAVLVEKFYEDMELWYPVLRFREAGCDVKIVGPKAGETYTSKHGYPARADVAAGDVKAADFDASVIPGGYSPDHMRRHAA